jgi:hypothetical protein
VVGDADGDALPEVIVAGLPVMVGANTKPAGGFGSGLGDGAFGTGIDLRDRDEARIGKSMVTWNVPAWPQSTVTSKLPLKPRGRP